MVDWGMDANVYGKRRAKLSARKANQLTFLHRRFNPSQPLCDSDEDSVDEA
jgi:hypothetical protein